MNRSAEQERQLLDEMGTALHLWLEKAEGMYPSVEGLHDNPVLSHLYLAWLEVQRRRDRVNDQIRDGIRS